MEQTYQELLMYPVIANLLSSALFSVGRFFCADVKDYIAHVNNDPFNLIKSDPIYSIIENEIRSLGEFSYVDDIDKFQLKEALGSSDIKSIVRQIFSIYLGSAEPENKLEHIKAELLFVLAWQLGKNTEEVEKLSNRVFIIFSECINSTINTLEKNSFLKKVDATELSQETRIIVDELKSISETLEFLTKPNKPSYKQLQQFEKDYISQVVERFSLIQPPFVDSQRTININDIYVLPNFLKEIIESKNSKYLKTFSSTELIEQTYRTVILGNPGGGKSTFAHKLCYDISTRYASNDFNNREIVPIHVVLRDYAEKHKSNDWSILDFIENQANSDYQISPVEGAFEYLLINRKALLVFDGLDELIDTSYRQKISKAIQSFCNRYPGVPVVVTSREVGYEKAPLDNQIFTVYRLASFEEEQVFEYASKWFRLDPSLSDKEHQILTQSFLTDSELVSDLRANPLMLGLMCNIYKCEKYIPKNRPDVYEKCAEMLFEKWDKSRGIDGNAPFENYLRPAMEYLANWIYSNVSLQSGVTEEQLVDSTCEFLYPDLYDDIYKARKFAKDFIEFCTGRAWVFTEVGLEETGQPLFKFTHRTFLEYFTAKFIVQDLYTPEKIAKFLLAKVAKVEYDMVAQLAFKILHRSSPRNGNVLFVELLKKEKTYKSNRGWNLLYFAARCLEFIVPTVQLKREIATTIINKILNTLEPLRPRNGSYSDAYDLMGALYSSNPENREDIASAINDMFQELIVVNKKKAVALQKLMASYAFCIKRHSNQIKHIDAHRRIRSYHVSSTDKVLKYWNLWMVHFYNSNKSIFTENAKNDLDLSLDLFEHGINTPTELFQQHGLSILFRDGYHLQMGMHKAPRIASIIFRVFIKNLESELFTPQVSLSSILEALADYVLKTPAPLLAGKTFFNTHLYIRQRFQERKIDAVETGECRGIVRPTSHSMFASFVLAAILFEMYKHKSEPLEDFTLFLIHSEPTYTAIAKEVILARRSKLPFDALNENLISTNLTSDQIDFIRKWYKEETFLIAQ